VFYSGFPYAPLSIDCNKRERHGDATDSTGRFDGCKLRVEVLFLVINKQNGLNAETNNVIAVDFSARRAARKAA
jgi:hypothetical protein